MNFNTFANKISKTAVTQLNEETEVTNPEFNTWYGQQDPKFLSKFADKNKAYRHWRSKGKAPASVTPGTVDTDIPANVEPTIEPVLDVPNETEKTVAVSLDGLSNNALASIVPVKTTLHEPMALRKTQHAVDTFKAANPEATVDDIINHLETMNDDPIVSRRTFYITDPEAIEKMVTPEAELPVVTGPEDLEIGAEKQSKMDRLRKFMMMKRGDRDKYLQSFSKKDDLIDNPEEQEDNDEIDPDVEEYLKGLTDEDEDEDSDKKANPED